MGERIAVCPGSFDPITKGHLDIIKRASAMFDKVIVVTMINIDKKPSFNENERVELIRRSIEDLGLKNVEVDSYSGLLADYTKLHNATAIVKGLRAVSDFEYELQLSQANSALCENIRTVFLTTKPKYNFISSSTIKEIYNNGGDISKFVPQPVYDFLMKRR